MNHNGFQESPAIKKRLLKKHEIMLQYFEKKYADFLASYDYDCPLRLADPSKRNKIWICWWQGLENAPELVKRCVESIRKNAGSYEVTLITEENYQKFVNLPSIVVKKYMRRIISKTRYSDILRLALLAKYGGVWLDATFFASTPFLERCDNLTLWSIKRPDYLHASVACGQFATYSLLCSCENRWIFSVILDFVVHYWTQNDLLIDYLFLDYLIVLAQRKNTRIAEAFRAIEPNNPRCDDLVNILSEPFDQRVWENLKKETSLFKLTWKQEFPIEKDGKKTFMVCF